MDSNSLQSRNRWMKWTKHWICCHSSRDCSTGSESISRFRMSVWLFDCCHRSMTAADIAVTAGRWPCLQLWPTAIGAETWGVADRSEVLPVSYLSYLLIGLLLLSLSVKTVQSLKTAMPTNEPLIESFISLITESVYHWMQTIFSQTLCL